MRWQDYISDVDDAELLDRVRRGNEEAFSQLFGRYQRAIHRYAAYMCGPDAGDDIVQETFLAVLRQTRRSDTLRGTVLAYLFGIARHRVLKRLASRHDEVSADDIDDSTSEALTRGAATVLDDLTRAETIEAVRAAIHSLPQGYREVVVLCELQELDYADAADLMQCPIGTVRSRLHRARTLLAAKLAAIQPVRSPRD